jgi:hypothetical protein
MRQQCRETVDVHPLDYFYSARDWLVPVAISHAVQPRPTAGPRLYCDFGAASDCYAFVFTYVTAEFIANKGPDDVGAMWHTGYPLSAKYGKLQRSSYYSIQSFDKDNQESASGTYHIHFKYNGQAGIILCHYDKPTGKFDRDEIVPDK